MPTVLLSDPFPAAAVERLRSLLPPSISLATVPSTSDEDFAKAAAEVEILLAIHRRIDADTLSLAPRLRFVQRAGAGYDNLDVNALRSAGILAAYTPGANSVAVAEHTIMLMLALLKKLIPADQGTRSGGWPMGTLVGQGLGDIASNRIGLVGFGSVGQAVAARLRPFGCEVQYTARHRVTEDVERELNVTYGSFSDVLATSRILSLHVPLTPETQGLLTAERLSQMPAGALLINTSRGAVVDEKALLAALEAHHLGGAGLDVLEVEAAGGNIFAHLPQVIVTPHIAGATAAATAQIMRASLTNIGRFLRGEKPLDIVPGSEP